MPMRLSGPFRLAGGPERADAGGRKPSTADAEPYPGLPKLASCSSAYFRSALIPSALSEAPGGVRVIKYPASLALGCAVALCATASVAQNILAHAKRERLCAIEAHKIGKIGLTGERYVWFREAGQRG